MHHLAKQPNLWRELQEKLRPIMDMFDRRPQIEKLAQLPFLNAVLNEGLRLSCPICGHMPRVVPSTGWIYRGTYFPPGVRFCNPLILLTFFLIAAYSTPLLTFRATFNLLSQPRPFMDVTTKTCFHSHTNITPNAGSTSKKEQKWKPICSLSLGVQNSV